MPSAASADAGGGRGQKLRPVECKNWIALANEKLAEAELAVEAARDSPSELTHAVAVRDKARAYLAHVMATVQQALQETRAEQAARAAEQAAKVAAVTKEAAEAEAKAATAAKEAQEAAKAKAAREAKEAQEEAKAKAAREAKEAQAAMAVGKLEALNAKLSAVEQTKKQMEMHSAAMLMAKDAAIREREEALRRALWEVVEVAKGHARQVEMAAMARARAAEEVAARVHAANAAELHRVAGFEARTAMDAMAVEAARVGALKEKEMQLARRQRAMQAENAMKEAEWRAKDVLARKAAEAATKAAEEAAQAAKKATEEAAEERAAAKLAVDEALRRQEQLTKVEEQVVAAAEQRRQAAMEMRRQAEEQKREVMEMRRQAVRECPVCLDELDVNGGGVYALVPCGHTMCGECAPKLSHNGGACPLCAQREWRATSACTACENLPV